MNIIDKANELYTVRPFVAGVISTLLVIAVVAIILQVVS